MEQPAWLRGAWGELGTREVPGAGDNPDILDYFRDIGTAGVTHDATPWCAAFLGACLERAGIPSTRSLLARSYLAWGEPASAERLGSIVVLKRGSDPAAGHVGFLVGISGDDVLLLGGNQGDAVSVARFPRADVLAVRWPSNEPASAPPAKPHQAPAPPDPVFAAALTHVLAMEGGYDDDPADPGGPTNFGLTLSDVAAARGVPLDAGTRAELLADLRSIAPAEVSAIYATHYWQPSRAGDLPPPLALMHFDTSVNMGLGIAARMLQQAVDADVDGEIGPVTLAAARAADPAAALQVYANLRRDRYRSLSGFARFGRGWLNRVDATLKRSLALIPANHAAKGPRPMTTTPPGASPATPASSSAPDPKWWGNSMTIWGTLITAVATVAPIVGPIVGIDISPEAVRQIGGQSADVARGLAGLVGTLMALYGRARAVQPLVRRDFSLRV